MKRHKRRFLPEYHFLNRLNIEWAIFGTLTFKGETPSKRIRSHMYFKLLRLIAKRCGTHFEKFHWVLREEIGPSGEQLHAHFVTIGKPQQSICEELCRQIEAVWTQSDGGKSKIDPYNSTLKGWGYILKPSWLTDKYRHDMADFLGTDGLTPSDSILELAERSL